MRQPIDNLPFHMHFSRIMQLFMGGIFELYLVLSARKILHTSSDETRFYDEVNTVR